MRRLAGMFSALLLITAAGCYYDKGDQVYPRTQVVTNSCDTTSVMRYSVEVAAILNANCNSCHGGTAAGGAGYKLDVYSGVQAMANNGRLVRAIAHTGAANTRMPMGASKLPECDIAKIRTWVRAGALNN